MRKLVCAGEMRESRDVAEAAGEAIVVGECVDSEDCQSRVSKPSITVSIIAIKSETLIAPKAKPIATYL